MKRYKIELVWNREFNWAKLREEDDLEKAKDIATEILYSGDGARVKKVRIIDNETGEVTWNK